MIFTVFTPTYNRGPLLGRLYQSLLAQDSKSFEWLIIDDGSTDDTASVVQTFIDEKKIDIRYYKKENGGKHTAYNYALDKACGDWFLCVDADDFLHKHALSNLRKAVENLTVDVGIAAYKEDMQGKRLSDAFPEDIRQCKISELALRYYCGGEFSLILPTKIALQYKFPVFPGERFVGECVVYDRIDEAYDWVLCPEVITVCEYQADGYSSNFANLMKRNPSGFCLYFLQRIDLQTSFLQRIIHAGKYWCFRWICKRKELKYRGKHKATVALATIPGVCFRIYYKLFRGI